MGKKFCRCCGKNKKQKLGVPGANPSVPIPVTGIPVEPVYFNPATGVGILPAPPPRQQMGLDMNDPYTPGGAALPPPVLPGQEPPKPKKKGGCCSCLPCCKKKEPPPPPPAPADPLFPPPACPAVPGGNVTGPAPGAPYAPSPAPVASPSQKYLNPYASGASGGGNSFQNDGPTHNVSSWQ